MLHVEMGAGKGALGQSIAAAFPGSEVTMVERSSVRRKVTERTYQQHRDDEFFFIYQIILPTSGMRCCCCLLLAVFLLCWFFYPSLCVVVCPVFGIIAVSRYSVYNHDFMLHLFFTFHVTFFDDCCP